MNSYYERFQRRDNTLTSYFVLVLVSLSFCSSSTVYTVKNYNALFEDCTPAEQAELTNFRYPITNDVLNQILIALINDTYFIMYENFCTYQVALGSCFPLYTYSTDFYYSQNGSLSVNLGYINITCTQPCYYTYGVNNFFQCVGPSPVELITFFPLSFNGVPKVYSIDGTLYMISGGDFNGTLEFTPQFLNNDYVYDEPFLLQYGCIPFGEKFYNFFFCPYPYCITPEGIYPNSYLEIYEYSSLCYGCPSTLPVNFTFCEESLKRDYTCIGNCPDSFSITQNGNSVTITNNGVTVFNGTTSVGSFSFNLTAIDPVPEPPAVSANQTGSALFWTLFALTMLLYLGCLIGIVRFIFQRCSSSYI